MSEAAEPFRSKKAALRKVSDVVAALVAAGGYDDLFGYSIENELTKAQQARLDWALDEVKRRLWAMGGEDLAMGHYDLPELIECQECGHPIEGHDLKGCQGVAGDECPCAARWTKAQIRAARRAAGLPAKF